MLADVPGSGNAVLSAALTVSAGIARMIGITLCRVRYLICCGAGIYCTGYQIDWQSVTRFWGLNIERFL